MTKNVFVFFALIAFLVTAFTVSVTASSVSHNMEREISSILNAKDDDVHISE